MKAQDALDYARRSKNNLRAAKVLLSDGLFEECCQMSHDATEKALKAVLLKNNIDPGNIHPIERLVPEVLQYLPSLEALREEIESLDYNYMPSRYPSRMKFSVTSEDAENDYRTATIICNFSFEYLKFDE
jgi:HEPN domain-containing protein